MTIDEAMSIATARGAEDIGQTAKYLTEQFPKAIEEYTREDFLDGTEPYEYVYLYKDDKFAQNRLINKVSARARAVKVTNFMTLYKAFLMGKSDAHDDLGNVTDFPNQPLALKCGKWLCDAAGVRTLTERGTVYACPHPIMPVARMTNIDTGIEKVKIAFWRGKQWRYAVFDRKTISSANKITDLADVGISVTSETARNLVGYFFDVEQDNPELLPEIECVTHLGWIDRGEGREFVPYTKDIVFDGEADYRDRFESVGNRGDFEKWTQCIRDNIRENPYPMARIVFAASLASPLVKLLNANCFWVHLWGESGSAKTVLMMCAASIWGNPERGKFVTTFNSTYVGNEKGAAFSGSLPYMLDELQILDSKKDMDGLIYMLTEGCGRARGNKQGGLDNVPRWKNSVISTGERPINSASSNGGALGRVVETECKHPFFGSGDHAREVVNIIFENHGFFGRIFISHLRKTPHETLDKIYREYYKQLSDRGFMDKQIQTGALILTADALACELLFDEKTQLTADEIAPFLKTKDEVSANVRGYEYVCQQVAANQLRFMQSDKPGEIWGEFDGDSVYIIKSQFDRICADGGFSPAPLLSWLADKRLIRRQSGKNTVTKRIGATVVRCVHLTVCADAADDEVDELPEF